MQMEKRLLQQALRSAHRHCPDISFAVSYWDAGEEVYGEQPHSFRLIFSDRQVVRNAIESDPALALGEAYIDGSFDVEGDLRDVISFLYRSRNAAGGFGNLAPELGTNGPSGSAGASPTGAARRGAASSRLARVLTTVLRLRAAEPTAGNLAKQAEDVRHHYDLGNDFFSLWLDETMSYSCAYFQQPEDSLEQAQRQKIDHTLRKLQLQPGESLLDIGSGWGTLIITAAQKYGVTAVGLTLSREQYKETKRRISDLGLIGQVDVHLEDYRNLHNYNGAFDKVVSVGMFEHVGKENHRHYFAAVAGVLKPGGIALLHTITQPTETALNPWLSRYIFPGGYVPSLREIVAQLPDHGFHPIDVESMRLHYAMTLDHWSERFENNVDAVRNMFDEPFVRMWRLYLRSCAASFRWSGLDIHQLLFTKGLNNDLPLTRSHLYEFANRQHGN